MPHRLTHEDRMRLLKFTCSFAWADLEVQPEEREFVQRLIEGMELDPAEVHQVQQWLLLPPRADEIDPQEVPLEHRELFLDAARTVVQRDGIVVPSEAESWALLEQLLK